MAAEEYRALQREYARLAARYDQRWSFYVEATLQATLQRLPVAAGQRVLDVGCGTGVLLQALTESTPGISVAGIDLSGAMIEVARHRLGPGVDLRQGQAEALPFADAEFDMVVSTSVFHFIRDPSTALQEMRRVTRPSGQVVITDWCDDYLACRLCDLLLRVVSGGHFRTYGSRQFRELFVRAGFTNVAVERYRISWLWGLMTATASAHSPGPGSSIA